MLQDLANLDAVIRLPFQDELAQEPVQGSEGSRRRTGQGSESIRIDVFHATNAYQASTNSMTRFIREQGNSRFCYSNCHLHTPTAQYDPPACHFSNFWPFEQIFPILRHREIRFLQTALLRKAHERAA